MKALTRTRLLQAGLEVLDEQGEAALTTTNVTRRAGLAQSSFYVHFADMDDLLHGLIDHLSAEWLRETREARRQSRSAPTDTERLRDTFRVPMLHSISHPQVFRLMLRSRTDRRSPLGDWSRSVFEQSRAALAEDLKTAGIPSRTEADRLRIQMVADGLFALTEAMIVGYLEGRYPDLEETIDILLAFSSGYLSFCTPHTAAVETQGTAHTPENFHAHREGHRGPKST